MEPAPKPWDEIFRREGRVYQEPAPVVAEAVPVLRERGCSRVLDVGCGSGRHVVYLAREGFQVSGLDNSPTALRLTREWLQEEGLAAQLLLADARRPRPFRDGAFDAVLSTRVIHHARLATIRGTAGEIGRVVRPGGVILVSVPARRSANEQFEEIEPNTFVPTTGAEKGLPHHIFAPEELPALFPGFQVLDLEIRESVVIVLVAVNAAGGTEPPVPLPTRLHVTHRSPEEESA